MGPFQTKLQELDEFGNYRESYIFELYRLTLSGKNPNEISSTLLWPNFKHNISNKISGLRCIDIWNLINSSEEKREEAARNILSKHRPLDMLKTL